MNANVVSALTVSVVLSSPTIPLNGNVTITVTSSESATGYIKVTMPDTTSLQININLAAGVPLSKTYPTDFPPDANTGLLGNYDVEVYIETTGGSRTNKAMFYVGFMAVVPEYPLGTITAILSAFVALAILQVRKHGYDLIKF
jgi:hypothetical protein